MKNIKVQFYGHRKLFLTVFFALLIVFLAQAKALDNVTAGVLVTLYVTYVGGNVQSKKFQENQYPL